MAKKEADAVELEAPVRAQWVEPSEMRNVLVLKMQGRRVVSGTEIDSRNVVVTADPMTGQVPWSRDRCASDEEFLECNAVLRKLANGGLPGLIEIKEGVMPNDETFSRPKSIADELAAANALLLTKDNLYDEAEAQIASVNDRLSKKDTLIAKQQAELEALRDQLK